MSKTLVVKVFRYDPNLDKNGRYQDYTVPYFDNMDVIDALCHIQNHLDPSLAFRYSCQEGKCGLCGVLVNGKPALACKHVLAPEETITIDPLSNFPIIKDLVINRDTYYEEQRTLQKEIEDDTVSAGPTEADRFHDYTAFKDCVECSLCTAGCPSAPALSHPHAGPSGFLQAVRAALFDGRASDGVADELFRCFLCGHCESVCPRDVPLRMLNRHARSFVKDRWPDSVVTLLNRLNERHVLMGSSGIGTAAWLTHAPTSMRARIQQKASLGVFVGCQFGMRQSRSYTPINLTRLLDAASVEYTLLGPEEWCCGHPDYLAGDLEQAKAFATHNIEAFQRYGVTEVVAGCPGCYTAWKTEYAEILGKAVPFKVWHTSVLLGKLLEAGQIKPKNALPELAVYHDPCELGRLNGIYNAPRFVLQEVMENLIELAHSREDSHCCGGGGLTLGADPNVAREAARRRVEEILDRNPSTIVTACPNCETVLEATLRSLGKDVPVLDLVDILCKTIHGGGAYCDG